MTERSPAQRPDARAVETRLRALASPAAADRTAIVGPPTEVLVASPATEHGAPIAVPKRRRWALLVVLAVALLALAAFASLRDSGSPAEPASTPSTTAATIPVTTTAPTTTVGTDCAQLQEQLDAVERQLKSLDDVFKGNAPGKADAKKQLDRQKKDLERSLGAC
jgi:hypothetical protein